MGAVFLATIGLFPDPLLGDRRCNFLCTQDLRKDYIYRVGALRLRFDTLPVALMRKSRVPIEEALPARISAQVWPTAGIIV